MNAALLDETLDAFPFLANDEWCAEEMLDGHRLVIVKQGSMVRCYSRDGVEQGAPREVTNHARLSGCDLTLDGELIGTSFVAFDLLALNGLDWTNVPFVARRQLLRELSPFPVVAHAAGEKDKLELFEGVQAAGGEGVVFKRLTASYQSGQRTYGVKFKFYHTDTFTIADVDISEGTAGLVRDGKESGRASFDFAAVSPRVGQLWEVRFDKLGRDGRLIRPQLLTQRETAAA